MHRTCESVLKPRANTSEANNTLSLSFSHTHRHTHLKQDYKLFLHFFFTKINQYTDRDNFSGYRGFSFSVLLNTFNQVSCISKAHLKRPPIVYFEKQGQSRIQQFGVGLLILLNSSHGQMQLSDASEDDECLGIKDTICLMFSQQPLLLLDFAGL